MPSIEVPSDQGMCLCGHIYASHFSTYTRAYMGCVPCDRVASRQHKAIGCLGYRSKSGQLPLPLDEEPANVPVELFRTNGDPLKVLVRSPTGRAVIVVPLELDLAHAPVVLMDKLRGTGSKFERRMMSRSELRIIKAHGRPFTGLIEHAGDFMWVTYEESEEDA